MAAQAGIVESSSNGVDRLIHPHDGGRIEPRPEPQPEHLHQMRRRDDRPHRQHAREDALGDDGNGGLGDLLW